MQVVTLLYPETGDKMLLTVTDGKVAWTEFDGKRNRIDDHCRAQGVPWCLYGIQEWKASEAVTVVHRHGNAAKVFPKEF